MNEVNMMELMIAAIILTLFGVAYNTIVHYLEEFHDNLWGYTAFFVALGTLITLLGAWYFIPTQAFLIVLGAFICTGIPMILGSVWRYIVTQATHKTNSLQIQHETLETAKRILERV